MLGLSWTSIRARALPTLTITAHATAPFIGLFLLVHLSAPALANVGGASLASQTMLLGREYYQTALSEPLLLLLPLSLHVLSGGIKRLIALVSTKSNKSRRLTHPLTLSALALVIILPTHYLTHRILPTLPQKPIFAVGPAELDFSFVQEGLKEWPVRSVLMYAGLVYAGAVHAVEGMNILRGKYLTSKKAAEIDSPNKVSSKFTARIALALGLCTLPLSGIYALANEPSFVFSDLASRYRAVFMQSWVYRL